MFADCSIAQGSKRSRSSNGLSRQEPGLSSSTSYVRFNPTRQQQKYGAFGFYTRLAAEECVHRSLLALMESSRSYIMKPRTWRKWER